jgi:hypothetical protein
MNKLKNYLLLGEEHFGSGSVNSDEFNTWVRVFKSQLRMELNKIGATDFEVNKGHFYVSGFFRVGEQLVYFSISDVRGSMNPDQMLVRTAEHNKDWTGGHNQYVTIQDGMSREIAMKFDHVYE